MRYHKGILFSIITLLLAGCELIVDVKVPYNGDQVVINGVQRNDSVWKVDLSRSQNILSSIRNIYFEIPNAEVFVYHPDGTTEKLEKVNYGIYKGVTKPSIGERYKVVVNATGFESVTAEMTMPWAVPITDVKFDSTNVQPSNNGGGITPFADVPFDVTFTDPGDQRNYYALKVFQWTVFKYNDENQNEHSDTLIQELPVWIQDPGLATKDERKFRFSDQIFNGKTSSIRAQTQFREIQEKIFRVDIWLMNLSEETFKYEETLQLQRDVTGDPFAQPVPVFSNVNGGLGIFSGNTISVKRYDRKID